MSLELYSLIPGQQVKRDRDLSNVTIQCDPLAVYPDNNAAGNRFKPGEAGKLAVEDEICDLTINGNLEVKGKLKLNGSIAAEICNIFCPNDFNLVAGGDSPQGNVNITAHNDISLLANGPGFGDITISTVGSTDGNITVNAEGALTLTAGTAAAASRISLDTSSNAATVLEMEINRVTQQTNLQTAVTLNSVSGVITLAPGAITAADSTSFQLNNSKIAADSVILLTYECSVPLVTLLNVSLKVSVLRQPLAGSCIIEIDNYSGTNLTAATTDIGKIYFMVLNPV